MSQTRLIRLVVSVATLLAAIVLPLYAFKVGSKSDYTDFIVYYRAGARWLAQHYTAIYSLEDGASPMRYAPPFLPLFGLFAHLPRMASQLLWYFVQYASFGAGFLLLIRTLRVSGVPHPAARGAVAAAFLLTLRLILDSFTIGQISGLMFFSFTLGLWGFVRKRPWLLAIGGLFPAWLKIGPGILLLLTMGVRDPRRGWLKTALPLLILSGCAVTIPLLGHWDFLESGTFVQLWNDWFTIVRKDSEYYDASHYGSQSINSVLLRLAHSGVISTPAATGIYVVFAVAIILGIVGFWWLRRPIDGRARILFYSQGLLSVMLLMPETFKYSLTPMAIPVAIFIADSLEGRRAARLTRLALLCVLLFVALPGKDIVGDSLFFAIQRLNLPFAALIILFSAVHREAYRRSRPSILGSALESPAPEEWDRSPQASSHAQIALVLVPLESDSRLSSAHAQRAVAHIASLTEACPVVFVPWGTRASPQHPVMQILAQSAHDSVLWLPNARESTAAQALRQAVLLTPHEEGLYLNLEQLPDGATLARALEKHLSPRTACVWSRRTPDSRLEFNGRSLELAYRRYRAGSRLQWGLKRFLSAPVDSTDLQSDAWQIRRQDFLRAASLAQLNCGLWQTELRLLVEQLGIAVTEDSAHFLIANEKPNARMTREILAIIRTFFLLFSQSRRSLAPLPELPTLTADDWGLSAGVNRGILDLVAQGVLKRVSIMTHGEALTGDLEELLSHASAGRVQLGLHFDLTYAPQYRRAFRSHGSPARTLIQWLRLSRKERTELARSALIEQLHTARGHRIPIQYLDGHHHIHLLPGLLAAIAPLLKDAGIHRIRIPKQPRRWLSARAPIHWLAVIASREIKRLGFEPTAEEFLYPSFKEFSNRSKLHALLQAHPRAEILTHPALWNDLSSLKTPEPHYQDERLTEYRNLSLIPLWQERETTT